MTTTFYNAEKDIAVAFKRWWERAKQAPQLVKENFTVETVPGIGVSNGAIKMKWKGQPLGYIGFPLELFEGIAGPVQRWMEKGTQHDPNFDPYEMEKVG